MSSFVGLLHLDGAPAAPEVVAAMLARLSHRVTPDGARRASVRCRGSVGLGCAVLPTTPQALLELENPDAHQVLQGGQNRGELWIACDGRLDNREELIGALGARGEARNWSDARLILEAHARWGEEAVTRLRGDFAYATWDAARQKLFCARDCFGTKPFYYLHIPGRLFAFASELKALWCVPGTDASLNPARIVGYLTSRFDDATSTYYRDARRLPPANWMSWTSAPGGWEMSQQTYWHLDGQSELELPGEARARDAGYAELVRAAFAESVGQRLRCHGHLAAFLSGGLDSSSIAALAERELPAERKPLTAASTVFDRFSQCDERFYIEQTLARGDFEPLWMNGDEISPLENLGRVIWHLDGPSPGPNICSSWAQYQNLSEAGVSVVLDGHGGDEIVSKGYGRVDELLAQRQFHVAWREIRHLHRQGVMAQSAADQTWGALLWHARDKRGMGRLSRPLRIRWIKRVLAADTTNQLDALAGSVIRPQALQLLDEEPTRSPTFSTRDQHAHEINGPLQVLALENLDALASAHAIEVRFPFWERELAQLCVSLPADQKLREGYNRYVMRRAMEGLLAPDVQWRLKKTDFGPQLNTILREREGARLREAFDRWEAERGGLNDYVDLQQVRAQWDQLQAATPGTPEAARPALVLWRVFSLGLWLENAAPSSAPTHLKPDAHG